MPGCLSSGKSRGIFCSPLLVRLAMIRHGRAWRAALVLTGVVPISVLGCGQGEALSGPTPPALLVTTASGGDATDPDGYTIAIDGRTPTSIGTRDSLLESSVTPGIHTVDLGGLAVGCAVEEGSSRSVTATVGATVKVDFTVTCTLPAPSETGEVRVTVSTSGTDPDPDGYLVAVDPEESRPVASSGEVVFDGVAVGPQRVRLSGLAGNCSVQGENPVETEVTAGGEVVVAFSVRCWPPAAGRIVFAQAQPGSFDPSSLAVISTGGNPQRQFSPTPFAERPSWSPHGDFIAFNGGDESFEATVRVLPASGSPSVQLPGCFLSAARPAWSPDGTRLVFAVPRDNAEDDRESSIYTVRADGSAMERLTASATYDVEPAWGP